MSVQYGMDIQFHVRSTLEFSRMMVLSTKQADRQKASAEQIRHRD